MLIKFQTAVTVALVALGTVGSNAAVCNGHSELCDRKYSNVTFIGSHGSPFVGGSMADNQHLPIAFQLYRGVRFLQAQTHRDIVGPKGIIRLCHTECFIRDAGRLEDLLRPIKEFLEDPQYENEVVTLLLTNPDGFTNKEFHGVFSPVGAARHAFVPDGDHLDADSWPTLGEMIARKQRLVVFIENPVAEDRDLFPYFLNEFDNNIVETPFEYSSLDDLAHCPIDRPLGAGPQDGMVLVNHWLQKNVSDILIPDKCMAIVTNSEKYINGHVQSCRRTLGKTPNFMLLDWINIGDAMRVQDAMNGLPSRTARQDVSVALADAGCENMLGNWDES